MAISIPMEHNLPHEVRIILVKIGVDGRVDMMWVRVGVDGATILFIILYCVSEFLLIQLLSLCAAVWAV